MSADKKYIIQMTRSGLVVYLGLITEGFIKGNYFFTDSESDAVLFDLANAKITRDHYNKTHSTTFIITDVIETMDQIIQRAKST